MLIHTVFKSKNIETESTLCKEFSRSHVKLIMRKKRKKNQQDYENTTLSLRLFDMQSIKCVVASSKKLFNN